MTHARGRLRAGLAVPFLFVLAAAVTFIALGTWQLQRKAWKETLIATLDHRLSAPPVPLPPREVWARLNPADEEFRRVSFSATFISEAPALVYTAGSSLRGEKAGPGYWVFAPTRLANGGILAINRGFVPENRKDAQTFVPGDVADNIDMAGVMRWPESRGYFTPSDQPGRNLWFVRDHLAIAAAKGWQARWGEMAPFYIELESPEPASGLPHPAVLTPSLRNAHLQYAITWYALAGAVIVMFAIWARNRGK